MLEKPRPRHTRHDNTSESAIQGIDQTRTALHAFKEELDATLGRAFQTNVRAADQVLGEWAQTFRSGISIAQGALAVFQSVSQEALSGYSRALGVSIADSLVYGTSIQAAMEKALKAVTANIAGQAATQAVYSTALGFLRLAEFDLAAAASAFEAAGVFASVAGAAGIVGANIPTPHRSSQLETSAGGHVPPFPPVYAAPYQQNPSSPVQVIVMGEAQAAAWLTKIINDGVKHQDLELTATRSKKSTYSH